MSLALASMLVASGVASAQEMADTTKVNVAFGQVSKADLMGGVSEVNVEELLKKDYSANALNDLQSLISGYNGNVWGQGALVLVDGAPREASTVNASSLPSVVRCSHCASQPPSIRASIHLRLILNIWVRLSICRSITRR